MRNNHRRNDKFLPFRDWELLRPGAERRVRREFRSIKRSMRGWSLLDLDKHEELFESSYPANFNNRYGIRKEMDHFWGVPVEDFISSHCGLHIDEVYRRLLLAVEHDPELREYASDAFLREVGQLRLKWNEDGTRNYGELQLSVEGGSIIIDESGIVRKITEEPQEHHPVRSFFKTAKTERVSYPCWKDDSTYWVSPNKCYRRDRVRFRFGQESMFAKGYLWFDYEKIDEKGSLPLQEPNRLLGSTIECLYRPGACYYLESWWRIHAAPSEVASHLDALWEESGKKLRRWSWLDLNDD